MIGDFERMKDAWNFEKLKGKCRLIRICGNCYFKEENALLMLCFINKIVIWS